MTFARTILASLIAAALVSAPASACSTCFGDPDSSMVKGAVMGVYVLVGIVSFVLAGIAGTSLFWIHRGRIIAAQEGSEMISRTQLANCHGRPQGARGCSHG